MIFGTHFLIYSENPEADRAFFSDVLEFKAVDAGHGWLIFKLPPAEVAVHPTDDANREPLRGEGRIAGAEIYLMCDDLQAEMKLLAAKNVKCGPVDEARWGKKTTFRLPSGGKIGLYQPKHQTALDLK